MYITRPTCAFAPCKQKARSFVLWIWKTRLYLHREIIQWQPVPVYNPVSVPILNEMRKIFFLHIINQYIYTGTDRQYIIPLVSSRLKSVVVSLILILYLIYVPLQTKTQRCRNDIWFWFWNQSISVNYVHFYRRDHTIKKFKYRKTINYLFSWVLLKEGPA